MFTDSSRSRFSTIIASSDIIVSRFFRIHPPAICHALLLWKSGRYSPIQQILDRLVCVLQIQIPRPPGQHYRRLELRQVGRKFVIELERGREHHAAPFVHGYRNRDADRELENEGGGTSFRGLNNLSQAGRKNRGEGGSWRRYRCESFFFFRGEVSADFFFLFLFPSSLNFFSFELERRNRNMLNFNFFHISANLVIQ